MNVPMIFENNSFGKITVVDNNGEFWFVAKEVAEILGYAQTNNMNKLIDDDDKCIRNIQNGGNYINQSLINESGLYTAIFGSTLPNAKAFKKWVTSEVLPSIRKTGSYSTQSDNSMTQLGNMPKIADAFDAMKRLAASFGFDDSQQIFSANNAIKRLSGVDCMDLIGFKQIEYKPNIQYHTPSVLGDMCGVSAVKMNKILEEKGLQKETRDNKNRLVWTVTEKGKEYSRLFDTSKTKKDGLPVQQIKWSEKVVDII